MNTLLQNKAPKLSINKVIFTLDQVHNNLIYYALKLNDVAIQ